MNEFDAIERYFRPLTQDYPGCAGLCDDGAVLQMPAGHELVVSSDTLNEGTHFLEGEAPEYIARKALRVNLSDLAAMGAQPLAYQLNIAFPQKPSEEWLLKFTDTLLEDQKEFGIFCSGGDTTSIKGVYLSISITVFGVVPVGEAVRRAGAKAGDAIVLTGPIGDAALGLKILLEGIDKKEYSCAVERYRVPQPRILANKILKAHAHAAVDISDGFLADLNHITKASNLNARIYLDRFLISSEMRKAIKKNIYNLENMVTGGDDYELIVSVPEVEVDIFLKKLKKINLNPYVVGFFEEGCGDVFLFKNDIDRIYIKEKGWVHF